MFEIGFGAADLVLCLEGTLRMMGYKGLDILRPQKVLKPGDDTPDPDEVPWKDRHKLFTKEDRERVGKISVYALIYALGFRMWDSSDSCHDRFNEFKRGVSEAGLYCAELSTSFCKRYSCCMVC